MLIAVLACICITIVSSIVSVLTVIRARRDYESEDEASLALTSQLTSQLRGHLSTLQRQVEDMERKVEALLIALRTTGIYAATAKARPGEIVQDLITGQFGPVGDSAKVHNYDPNRNRKKRKKRKH